ncbi:hypothetical protein HPB51_008625 [Rhipicephalus microplus]|uniref:Apple domain-containing protein n=1 Tax=Rhipicephalus microplus TaxID=6941 RepID=A0A9J6EN59_RHIMP|nr:hypothetical protein HPB51_008625 [Rhipicephalus microplus]
MGKNVLEDFPNLTELAHGRARELTRRDSLEAMEGQNDALLPFNEITTHYQLVRRIYPLPYAKLNRAQSATLRMLQTGSFPSRGFMSKIYADVDPSCPDCNETFCSMARMLWRCPALPNNLLSSEDEWEEAIRSTEHSSASKQPSAVSSLHAAAQSCNNGVGKLVYEKISDYKLSAGFGGGRQRVELITRAEQPIKVLEECVRRCQEDRTTAVAQCLSFDFMPGRRRPPTPAQASGSAPVEFEESVCYLYYDRASPDGGETLVRQNNAWHYNEVCLSSSKVITECSSRLYVFDRSPGYRMDGVGDKEMYSSNRTECEDKCLSEASLVCRSATYDRAAQLCRLSPETRYMNPKGFKPDSNAEYMENLCLPSSQLCTTTAFILEAGKELDGAFEREVVSTRDLQECSNYCTRSLSDRGYFCRSFLFDDKARTCTLYDEDPLGYGEGSEGHKPLKSSTGDLYRVLCGSSERGKPRPVFGTGPVF